MIINLDSNIYPQARVLELGSDSCCWSIVDPVSLPSDFDEKSREDPTGMLEELQARGLAFSEALEGDGCDLTMALCYVNDKKSVSLDDSYTVLASFPQLSLPSERLVFCGSEYVCKDPLRGSPETPQGGLEQYPHMGTIVNLPNVKTVSLDIYHSPSAYELRRKLLRERIPRSVRRKEALAVTGFVSFFYLAPLLVLFVCGLFGLTSFLGMLIRVVVEGSFRVIPLGHVYSSTACMVLAGLAYVALRRGPHAFIIPSQDSVGARVQSELELEHPTYLVVIQPTELD
jgi:hypothetical protein